MEDGAWLDPPYPRMSIKTVLAGCGGHTVITAHAPLLAECEALTGDLPHVELANLADCLNKAENRDDMIARLLTRSEQLANGHGHSDYQVLAGRLAMLQNKGKRAPKSIPSASAPLLGELEALTSDLKHVDVTNLVDCVARAVDRDDMITRLMTRSQQLATDHSEYQRLAGRLAVLQIKQTAAESFSESMERLYTTKCRADCAGCEAGTCTKRVDGQHVMPFVRRHAKELNAMVDVQADMGYGLEGVRVLQGGHLWRDDKKQFVETPQFARLRTATSVHARNMEIRYPWVRTHNLLPLRLLCWLLVWGAFEWVLQWLKLPHVVLMVWFIAWCVLSYTATERRWYLVGETSRPLGWLMAVFDLDAREHAEEQTLERIRSMVQRVVRKEFSPASPVATNTGGPLAQHASCFLFAMRDDSLEAICEAKREIAMASKGGGGCSLSVSKIRARGSYIRGTQGYSDGLVPMLRVFEKIAEYVNQGGGKRPGAVDIAIDAWHADIRDVLRMRHQGGTSLFFSVNWHDLLFKRIEQKGSWSGFCPGSAPGLEDVWGDEFEALYERYERQPGLAKWTLPAEQFALELAEYYLSGGGGIFANAKDTFNRLSNQQNLGTIRQMNLCQEIALVTGPLKDEHAPWSWRLRNAARKALRMSPLPKLQQSGVCNLASLPLPSFLSARGSGAPTAASANTKANEPTAAYQRALQHPRALCVQVNDNKLQPEKRAWLSADGMPESERNRFVVDHARLYEAAYAAVIDMNAVMDTSATPSDTTARSNELHRPLGIGVIGLADLLAELGLPFDCELAMVVNEEVFETIQFGCWQASADLAARDGAYATFWTSPAAKGNLQHILCGRKPEGSDRWPWAQLIAQVRRTGVRNSMITAVMPTVSTGPLTGMNECIEPPLALEKVNKRKTGDFVCYFAPFYKCLERHGLDTPAMRARIRAAHGSIQAMLDLPEWMRATYRTVWEIPTQSLIRMAKMRAPWIDQSQSFNVWLSVAEPEVMLRVLFQGWMPETLEDGTPLPGLKNLAYYVYTPPDSKPMAMTQGTGRTALLTPADMISPVPIVLSPSLSMPSSVGDGGAPVCTRADSSCKGCS